MVSVIWPIQYLLGSSNKQQTFNQISSSNNKQVATTKNKIEYVLKETSSIKLQKNIFKFVNRKENTIK